jgi:hypothetical protein
MNPTESCTFLISNFTLRLTIFKIDYQIIISRTQRRINNILCTVRIKTVAWSHLKLVILTKELIIIHFATPQHILLNRTVCFLLGIDYA